MGSYSLAHSTTTLLAILWIGVFIAILFSSIPKRPFLIYSIGLFLCVAPFLYYHAHSAHSPYGGDFDFGWPLRYGYTQNDAGPADLNPLAFIIDAALGFLLWQGLQKGYRKLKIEPSGSANAASRDS
jgi:hypothetical protein